MGGKRLSFHGVTIIYTVDPAISGMLCIWKNLDTGDTLDATIISLVHTHDRPTVANIRRYLESHGVAIVAAVD
jgi:hypothetical protein